MPVRALSYIGIGVHGLFSLSLFRNCSPKNPLSVCNPPEDFGKGVAEDFRPFSISLWVLLSILFIRIVLNTRFSVAGKAPTMELYAGFWDVPIPGCIPIVFEKLLSLRFWSCLLLCQEILELIPVLCLPIK